MASAPGSGLGGRGFKSHHPDVLTQKGGDGLYMKKHTAALLVLSFFIPSTLFAMGREPKEKKSSQAGFAQVSATGSKRVELYVTSWCGYCKKLEKHLKERGISYDRYDIEADQHAADVFHSIGGTGVPVTRIGSDVVYGYDPDRIAELL